MLLRRSRLYSHGGSMSSPGLRANRARKILTRFGHLLKRHAAQVRQQGNEEKDGFQEPSIEAGRKSLTRKKRGAFRGGTLRIVWRPVRSRDADGSIAGTGSRIRISSEG